MFNNIACAIVYALAPLLFNSRNCISQLQVMDNKIKSTYTVVSKLLL